MRRIIDMFKNKSYIVVLIVFLMSVSPMIFLGVYTYPQSDDFCQSASVHNIWNETHSLISVFKYSVSNAINGWKTWGGGFSSGIFCSLQPDAFVYRGYAIVPFLFISLLALSIWIFTNVVMINIFNINRNYSRTIAGFAMIYVIWNIPDACQAFYWYQGAAHYILPFSMLLITSAMIILGNHSNHNYLFCCLASVTGVMVGGANLVSALLMAILYVLFAIYFIITKQKKMICWIVPFLVFFVCFILNVASPGNSNRQASMGIEPENPIKAIINSFGYALHYCFSEWMNIFVIMLLLIMIPFIWKGLVQCEYSFKYPAVVALISFCLVAAMYAPTAYAEHSEGPGRVQNIIFSFHIICLALNEVYIIGWLRNNVKFKLDVNIKHYIFGCIFLVFFLGFISYRYDDKYCNVLTALSIIKNGKAIEYAEIVSDNMEILNSNESVVVIYKVVDGPSFFYSREISDWKEGTKAYFNKESIEYFE